jgi:hypothetical protein
LWKLTSIQLCRPLAQRARTYTLDTDFPEPFENVGPDVKGRDWAAAVPHGHATQSPPPLYSRYPSEQSLSASNERGQPSKTASFSDPFSSSHHSNNETLTRLQPSSSSLADETYLKTSSKRPNPDKKILRILRSLLSSTSLTSIESNDAAFQWVPLCQKVRVERTRPFPGGRWVPPEIRECYIYWKYREDGGISLCSVYRSSRDRKARVWTQQDFSALGPPIPLATTVDGETIIEFPRNSFGTRNKQWVDMKYICASAETSITIQTLLYTNNGRNPADLLFDRPIRSISSDKHNPECRARNIRLWRRTETHDSSVDVLVLLFYTSCLEEKGHWVEEPHYAFEWLTDSAKKRLSDKLTLTFSKDPGKWSSEKVFRLQKTLQVPHNSSRPASDDIKTARLEASLNRFGYTRLDIEFQNHSDRKAFTDVWARYVKPLSMFELATSSPTSGGSKAPLRYQPEDWRIQSNQSYRKPLRRGSEAATMSDAITLVESISDYPPVSRRRSDTLTTSDEITLAEPITVQSTADDAFMVDEQFGPPAESPEVMETTICPRLDPQEHLPLPPPATPKDDLAPTEPTASLETVLQELPMRQSHLVARLWMDGLIFLGLSEPASLPGKTRVRWQCVRPI